MDVEEVAEVIPLFCSEGRIRGRRCLYTIRIVPVRGTRENRRRRPLRVCWKVVRSMKRSDKDKQYNS